MRHPNVVSFIGVTRTPFQFVSEWMPNGTLTEYVNENPGVDRVALVSLSSVISTRLTFFLSCWMWQKVLTIFMQITQRMET